MSAPIVAVDYTSRDFSSIRQDLLALAPKFLPQWTNIADTDFGVVLLDLFAYMADGLHYYMDRVANESYIDTATQRANVLRLAKLLNYVPSSNVAAQVTLTFTNSSNAAYTVPALTSVGTISTAASATLPFETDAAVTVAPNSTANVNAHQGTTVSSEAVGTSNGTPSQSFTLFQNPVIDHSVSLVVTQGAVTTTFTQVDHLIDYGPGDNVFSVYTDENGVASIQLGDGINGVIPNNGSTLAATYRIGGGSVGNVQSATITSILSPGIPGYITVNNGTAAIGGADFESTDDIRRNAPAASAVVRRCISLNDYALLAVNVTGVAKANAIQGTPGSVVVYVAPVGGGGLNPDTTPTAQLTALKSKAQGVIQAAAPANVTVSVLGPTYVNIDVSVDINIQPNATQSRVNQDCQTAIANLLSFGNVIFGDLITTTDLHTALAAVNGVSYVNVTKLARGGGTGTAPVSLAPGEIPQQGTVTTNPIGGL